MIDAGLLLDKPVGISSNRALQEAKKLLGAKKAGHAGTLDPLASGLLLLLFGEATKLAGPLMAADKEYREGAHTIYDLKYHVVWVTKYRYKILTGERVRAEELMA